GWKHLAPWTHFWTGVPVVISGLGGAFSVVAVNSWMNQPQGFSPTTGDVASVDAVGMLRGRRDRLHRLGLLIPLTLACILTPVQFMVGDTAARAIAKDQP